MGQIIYGLASLATMLAVWGFSASIN